MGQVLPDDGLRRRPTGRSSRDASGLTAFLALGAAMALCLTAPVHADERPLSKGSRTRGLTGGWGHSWRPIFGQTRTQITFVAFDPRMGWFVTDRLELYGEGTLFLYNEPQAAVAAGLVRKIHEGAD